jgi:hypothetical protein
VQSKQFQSKFINLWANAPLRSAPGFPGFRIRSSPVHSAPEQWRYVLPRSAFGALPILFALAHKPSTPRFFFMLYQVKILPKNVPQKLYNVTFILYNRKYGNALNGGTNLPKTQLAQRPE